MVYYLDVTSNSAPDLSIGALGGAVGAALDSAVVVATSGDNGGYAMAEVSNHNSKMFVGM